MAFFFRVGAVQHHLSFFLIFPVAPQRGIGASPQLPLHRQETVSIETLPSCFCAPSAAVKAILEWAHLESAWTGDAARSRVKVIGGGALPWKQACSVTLLTHEALKNRLWAAERVRAFFESSSFCFRHLSCPQGFLHDASNMTPNWISGATWRWNDRFQTPDSFCVVEFCRFQMNTQTKNIKTKLKCHLNRSKYTVFALRPSHLIR